MLTSCVRKLTARIVQGVLIGHIDSPSRTNTGIKKMKKSDATEQVLTRRKALGVLVCLRQLRTPYQLSQRFRWRMPPAVQVPQATAQALPQAHQANRAVLRLLKVQQAHQAPRPLRMWKKFAALKIWTHQLMKVKHTSYA